jgi:Ca-activated chloride channel family protein
MYKLEHPEYFYWLVILPIVWVLYFTYLWWQKRTQEKFAESALFAHLTPERSVFKSVLKMVLWSLGITFLILALVNPKIGTSIKKVQSSGVDVVFAIDVSKSMLAEDIAPSRLEKAKLIVSGIVDKLGGDRVGIIIYAGSAYPLLPITTDHAAAKMFLDNAHPDLVSSQGTAIGEALKLAQTYYDADEETGKYLIILSDGEDHEEKAATLSDYIRGADIKTFTIGLGTTQGGPIPISKIGGIKYKKDQEGNMVITQLHEEILRKIADTGNGDYIDGNRTKEAIDAIAKALGNADKKDLDAREFTDFKDQFQWFIALGLLCIILEVFLLEKKTVWLQKLNLFNEGKA